MKTTRRGPGIIWMVRLLGALGFVMVAVMIGQNGLQLQSMRTSRVRLQEQLEHLNQSTREILQRAGEARREIQAALDENTPFTEKSGAVTSLAQAARQLSQSTACGHRFCCSYAASFAAQRYQAHRRSKAPHEL